MVGDMRRYAASLAAVVALAGVGVGVAGCTTSGPGAQGSPPASAGPTSPGASSAGGASGPATSTVTAGATTTLAYPADVPAQARVDSPAGAMAFARYFFAQVNKAYTTPQAGLIAPISAETCKTCETYEGNSKKYVALGQRHTLEPIQVVEVSIAPDSPPTIALTVDVVIRQRPSQVIESTGVVVEKLKDRQAVFAVDMVRNSDQWFVAAVQVRQG